MSLFQILKYCIYMVENDEYKCTFRTDILILLISFLKQLCIISYIYIYIVYSFYVDNNCILVIFRMYLRKKIDVAKSVKKTIIL